MEARFLEYYNRELRYIRELGGEFARDFPKVAGRLGLDSFQCADPYVERLLEGFAFLAARVQLKIDAEFPRFTEQLLALLCPHYFGPTPSMAVVQFHPDPKQGVLEAGFVVPRGTSLASQLRSGQMTPCEYRTGQDVTLWPIELAGVAHSADVSAFADGRTPVRHPARASVRIRLRTTHGLPFSQLPIDRLALFIRGTDGVSLRLFEMLLCGTVAAVVRDPASPRERCAPAGAISPLGFSDAEGLLPCGPRGFEGYRMLHEYFAFPERFLFAQLSGLAAGARLCRGQEVEIVVAVDRHDPTLEGALTPGHVALFCTPAINLFPKKTDRIRLDDRENEFHVVADRTRPLDFEVHSIVGVSGYGMKGDMRREFRPLYQSRGVIDPANDGAFYTVTRRARLAAAVPNPKLPRSNYLGGEVFLSLVDGDEGPYRSDLRQLGIQALCTNRDLPLRMPVAEDATDFYVESGAPVEAVRCVAGPSAPRPTDPSGETAWRLISHLSLNYLSLSGSEAGGGAAALRELLQLYGNLLDPSVVRQIDGVRAVGTRPVVRRLPFTGPVTFARGIELTVECDEAAFEGRSLALFGVVLEQFFARYVSINSFTQTVLRSPQRGEVARWAPRIGRRPTL